MTAAEKLLERWLSGTTCFHKKRSIFWTNGRYVVLKHHGHSEYIGRMSPTAWCGTWHALYDTKDASKIDVFGRPCLWMHEGRWSKKCWREVSATITARTGKKVT